MDAITANLQAALHEIRHGKVFIEANIADGNVVSANITGSQRGKKVKDTVEAGTDIINILQQAVKDRRNGSMTFTIVLNEGKANKILEDDVIQVRNR